MFIYEDRITLPAHYTDRMVESIVEKIREVGSAELRVSIAFTLEAESLWELRGIADELSEDLDASYEATFDVSLDCVHEVKSGSS
jgi:hypothetical protein